MHRESPIADRGLAQVVERQMRNWEIARQQRVSSPKKTAAPVANFISLSRAVGLEAEEIAASLHEKLGWPIFDKEVLRFMAHDDACKRRVYDQLDERDRGWLEGIVCSLTSDLPARDDYFHNLTATISALARQGPAIFIGRAADLILPKSVGLRVRLTASRNYCVHRFAERQKILLDRAETEVDRMEKDRTRFIHNHFHVEGFEPTRYDLVVNMERFTRDEAVGLILAALEIRGIR